MSGQPNPLRRKEWQDEARREQQADERIRELEKKNEALRRIAYDLAGALRSIAHAPESDDTSPEKRASDALVRLQNGECDLRDEHIRELEGALQDAIYCVRGRTGVIAGVEIYTPQIDVKRVEKWQDALDGGGDHNA